MNATVAAMSSSKRSFDKTTTVGALPRCFLVDVQQFRVVFFFWFLYSLFHLDSKKWDVEGCSVTPFWYVWKGFQLRKVVIRNNHNVDLSILWDFGVCTLLGVVHIVEIRKISFGVWFLLWVLKCIYERSCTWVLHDKLDWVGERRY